MAFWFLDEQLHTVRKEKKGQITVRFEVEIRQISHLFDQRTRAKSNMMIICIQ